MRCRNCGVYLASNSILRCPHCGGVVAGPEKKKAKNNPFIKILKGIVGTILVLFMIASFFTALLVVAVSITEEDPSMLIAATILLGACFGAVCCFGKMIGHMKETFRVTGIIICAILGIVLFTLILASSAAGGDGGTIMHAIGWIGLSALGIFYAVKKQDRVVLIAVIIGTVAYYINWFLATNNIPEFIRAIPGSSFIFVWWLWIAVIYAAAMCVFWVYAKNFASRHFPEVVGKQFIDGDLMLLQGNNRYKMCGYYLMKARLLYYKIIIS